MKCFHPSKIRLRAGLCLAAFTAAIYVVSNSLVIGADTKSTEAKTTEAKTAVANHATKPRKHVAKLTGSELYSINCNRCHPERYPTEFKSSQWKTLMTHMRVRANLPPKQAKEILKYLQEDSGN